MSFGAMRRQLRFRHAAELLEAGASVIEAALAVGYQSHSAFTTRFAQAMGCAPSGFADHQDRESRMAESVPPLTDMAG
jgi:methylphosphotriester-DNA--protein-cysteine methyltransferase